MSICRLGQDCERRLKLAGGSAGLVESVVAKIEHGLSLYKRDNDSLDEDYFESLKPDLDALIKITEEVTGATQSRLILYQRRSQKALLTIGNCQANISAKQGELDTTNGTLASIHAKVDLDRQKVQDLEREIEENNRKLAEVRANNNELMNWWWVPGYGQYLSVRAIVELCEDREKTLCNDLNHGCQELNSTYERLEEERRKHDALVGEKRVLEWTIRDLRDSRMVLEQKCKVYTARFVLLSDILLYYRMLRGKIGIMKASLDLPQVIEKLYESRKLVQLNGEARQVTLKAALIYLGGDYDRHLQSGADPADGVQAMTFKLFPMSQPLPSNYRLATVEEATDNKRALFNVMPSWEIANLADGSVSGKSYHDSGKSYSSQVRKDVGHKLAVEE
ncbi:hypothetical protein M758_9G182300 [Ceratodon purpureus]|nr:hypothetical protein M758_9G182300 [Ceratodon purpureus]